MAKAATNTKGKKIVAAKRATKSVKSKKVAPKKLAVKSKKSAAKKLVTKTKKKIVKKVVAKKMPAKKKPAAKVVKNTRAKKAAVKKAVKKVAPKVKNKKSSVVQSVFRRAKAVVNSLTKKRPEKKAASPIKERSATKSVGVKKTAVKKSPARKVAAKPVLKAKQTMTKLAPKVQKIDKQKLRSIQINNPIVRGKESTVTTTKPIPKKIAMTKTANLGTMGIPPYRERQGESYMSPEQLNHFREILLRWKAELMQGVDSTIHHMQDDAANFPDPNDRATQEEEFSLELRARDRDRKLIKKIEEALQKIEDDEYGYCEECGIEIGIRRLEARPTAVLCIDCKTLDEIKEKQIAG